MEIKFNVTGAERKRLVGVIEEFLGCEKKYLGAPSFAYQVGGVIIGSDGTVEIPDGLRGFTIDYFIESLAEKGFAEIKPTEAQQTNENSVETLTISMPINKVNIENLKALLAAKGTLIKKALGIDDLPIEISESKVTFPWFSETDSEAAKAHTHFISALCGMSREHRIIAKEKPVDNEKYAFRCFLLRLGFIGKEYKDERKILLKNLSGNSAFKSGSKKQKAP